MTTSTESLLLDHYHCTFFMPLLGLTEQDFQPIGKCWTYQTEDSATSTESDTAAAKLRQVEAQAYRYFSPAIRNIMFDFASNHPANVADEHALTSVKEWRIPPETLSSWELHLSNQDNVGNQEKEQSEGKEDKSNPLHYQIAKVTAVTLYRYFNGIYLLAFRVIPKALDNLPKDSPLFDNNGVGYLADIVLRDQKNKAHYQQLQLESWLRFTRLARLVYPSFSQQNNEEKIAPMRLFIDGKPVVSAFDKKQNTSILKQPGKDISPVIRHLLKAFAQQPIKLDDFLDNYQYIYDDRMFVSVAYGLAGKQQSQERLEKLFHLALYVDRHQDAWACMDGHAYTPDAIKKITQPRHFDLWNGLGSYFGYTEFSNAYLSCGGDFRSYIAPEHITNIYDRMLIQALFYQATLRHSDNNICRQTTMLLKSGNLKSIRKQRDAFIRFTNQYWFHDLTEQMQGKAIFKLQQQALGLKKHYDIIKDELERTDEYLLAKYETDVANFTKNFTTWGLSIAIFALYYALIPLMPADVKAELWTGLWGYLSCLPSEEYTKLLVKLLAIPLLLISTLFGCKSLYSKIKSYFNS